MKKLQVLVAMLAMVTGLIAGPVFADHQSTGGVAATVTPGLVSVSVSAAPVGYGTVLLSPATGFPLTTGEPSPQNCATSPAALVTVLNNGNLNADFSIKGANSSELVDTGTISTQTGAAGTVTVTTSAPHGLTVPDEALQVRIRGAGAFNGIFEIAVVTPASSSFSYVSPVTGTLAAGTFEVRGLPGSGDTGWDLNLPAGVTDNSVDLYAHGYTALGGSVAGACDFAGSANPGANGKITTITGAGPITTVTTATPHGLPASATVIISGTVNYNGEFLIPAPSGSTFDLPIPFVAAEAGGFFAQNNVSTDGALTLANTPLGANAVPNSTTNVFLQVGMPRDTTKGTKPQVMPVIIQVSQAAP